MKQPDSGGKYPLTWREFDALRTIRTAFNSLSVNQDALRERLKLIPGGWRDMRMLTVVARNLTEALYHTIPIKKLAAIDEEIKHSSVLIAVRGADSTLPGVMYMDEKALCDLIDISVSRECLLCEKCGKQAKRCVIRRTIEDVMHYELDPSPDPDACPLAGWDTIRRGDDP